MNVYWIKLQIKNFGNTFMYTWLKLDSTCTRGNTGVLEAHNFFIIIFDYRYKQIIDMCIYLLLFNTSYTNGILKLRFNAIVNFKTMLISFTIVVYCCFTRAITLQYT